ncbi:MAG: ABC-2 transporter permease [Peptococcaceae bacterium]|nr:ABC-2 transporter permease [Peptococcaceae bacterium]
MFNLVLKDLLVLKKNFLFGIVYILIMIVAFQQIGGSMLAASIVVFSYMMVQLACAYDEKNKADILLNSLPLNRSTIVIARYISTFIFTAISIVYYLLLSGLIKVLHLPLKVYPVSLEGILGALFALILVCGIYLPIFFKMGYIKSKLLNFVLFFGVFFGGAILLQELITNKDQSTLQRVVQFLNEQSTMQVAVEISAVMILLLFISFMFSLRNYKKREF